MQRRQFIATVGATMTVSAGCVRSPGSGIATPTDESGAGESRFEEIPCPSFADVDRTVCYHTIGGRSQGIYVEPSTELFEPAPDDTAETLDFVLYNQSENSFGLNPHAWELHKRTDDGWSFLAPEVYIEPWYNVSSGGTYTWHLRMEPHSSSMSEDAIAIVQDLPTGTYAFQTTGIIQSEPDTGTNVECIALFEIRRET
jgi:hypothetical protein